MSDQTSTTTRQQALNAASGAASKRLKTAHSDEWDKYMVEEAKARGQEWQPKASPEQKATAEFERLLSQYPHLAEQVAKHQAQADGPEPSSEMGS